MVFVRPLIQCLCVIVFMCASVGARASDLATPAGAVILKIEGQMERFNGPTGADFDLDMLQQIGAVTFSTSTPWTEGVQAFTGVPLNRLLAHIGAAPTSLTVIAINEYEIDIPASDAVDGGPILAWQQDGELLSTRDKGPLWLIYPFDAKTEYRTEEIHSRAVWQVVQIDLNP